MVLPSQLITVFPIIQDNLWVAPLKAIKISVFGWPKKKNKKSFLEVAKLNKQTIKFKISLGSIKMNIISSNKFVLTFKAYIFVLSRSCILLTNVLLVFITDNIVPFSVIGSYLSTMLIVIAFAELQRRFLEDLGGGPLILYPWFCSYFWGKRQANLHGIV